MRRLILVPMERVEYSLLSCLPAGWSYILYDRLRDFIVENIPTIIKDDIL